MAGDFHYMVKSPSDVPRGIYERHPLVVLELSAPRVSIYCAEGSHAGDPWFIASFVRGRYAAERWNSTAFYPTDDGHGFWIGQGAMQGLVGDQPLKDEVLDPLESEFRGRYALLCKTCGLRRTRRADEINADLERLWSAGVFEVPLRAFAATMRERRRA